MNETGEQFTGREALRSAVDNLKACIAGPEERRPVLRGPYNNGIAEQKDRIVNWITAVWGYFMMLSDYLDPGIAAECDEAIRHWKDMGYDDLGARVVVPDDEIENVKTLISRVVENMDLTVMGH
ncbi:MAG TPA: hypothetical protein PK263_05180 [bacterium]|nr:hypothetical protein [bacterium]